MTEGLPAGDPPASRETGQHRRTQVLPRVLWLLPVAALGISLLVALRSQQTHGLLSAWRGRAIVFETANRTTGASTPGSQRAPRSADRSPAASLIGRPAPPLQLYDQHSRLVRLQAYQGRHPLAVLFLGEATDNAATVALLRNWWIATEKSHTDELHVFAISPHRPAEHRDWLKSVVPGSDATSLARTPRWSLLSDLEGTAHQQWQAWDAVSQRPAAQLILIDRRGWVIHTEPIPFDPAAIRVALRHLQSTR